MRTKELELATSKALNRTKLFLLAAGFATKSNGIFVSMNQDWFGLDYTEAMFAPTCFFLASLISAPLAGSAIQKYGYRPGVLYALFISALSCLMMAVSHSLQNYYGFLASLFFFGGGVKALLVAGASYAMSVGAKATESGRVSLAQAFYSVGSVAAPVLISTLFMKLLPSSYVPSSAYLTLFFIWSILAFTFYRLGLLPTRHDFEAEKRDPGLEADASAESAPFFTPSLIGGFLCMFLYMGMEVCLDSSIVKFLEDPSGGGLNLELAVSYFIIYHLGFVAGRFAGASVLKRVAPYTVLFIHAFIGLILFLTALGNSGSVATWAMLAMGFSNSVLYPTIIALGVQEQKRGNARATGFLNMASIGGAIFPLLQGSLADSYGLHQSFYLLVICFIGILAYAIYMRYRSLNYIAENTNIRLAA
ncbi:MAG: glucose/galactose transporter [Chlamydiales bacterium]|jgi:FHS family L-fucose permease-like MFS transporter|nr:glucose/galactose transporter [Chlamydiales bacterium]